MKAVEVGEPLLQGKRALVTGAAGVIGRACAERLAALVGYLCGPEAAFISGTSIVKDGGWTAR